VNFQKLKEERTSKVVHHSLACGGEARLSGSRVCVWNIIWNLNNGRTEQELLVDFPRLTPADIEAAKEYYRCNKQEIDYDIYNHSQRRLIIEKLSEGKDEGRTIGLADAVLPEQFEVKKDDLPPSAVRFQSVQLEEDGSNAVILFSNGMQITVSADELYTKLNAR